MTHPTISNASIADHFAGLPDPRFERTKLHPLLNILVISLCAMICGADSFTDMEDFGESKRDWLSGLLDLSNGIPSHDTFARVFAALDPQAFTDCFISWTSALADKTDGQVIALDGKRLRRSFDTASGTAALHMVSAWATQNNLVLGQVAVADKSNEITAIPKLLEMLDVAGCIVTIDAMGTQKAIAGQIARQGADYVLALKANQPDLHAEVSALFERATANNWLDHNADTIPHSFHNSVDGPDHGRIETRRCWATGDLSQLHPDTRAAWPSLRSIALIEAERIDKTTGQTTTEQRFYITSLAPDARQIANAVRSHWGIENSLHWILDVALREDDCRIREGHAPQNMATMRHITINMLKKDDKSKLSIRRKRLVAGWKNSYLQQILTQHF